MKRPSRPIRIFYSTLSNRFYATSHWREVKSPRSRASSPPNEVVFQVTGEKFDVTDQIASLIDQHQLTFTMRTRIEREVQ